MFERFTQEARRAVVDAQVEARGLGHGWVGTEHLLLAVLADDDSRVAVALHGVGLTTESVRAEVRRQLGPVDDGAALAGIGIDLDEVRRRVEDRFGPGVLEEASAEEAGRSSGRLGPVGRRWSIGRLGARGSGHLPFTSGAKKALELALREAVAARSREIRVAHLALGLMREDGLAARAVSSLGVSPDTVRRTVLELDRAA